MSFCNIEDNKTYGLVAGNGPYLLYREQRSIERAWLKVFSHNNAARRSDAYVVRM